MAKKLDFGQIIRNTVEVFDGDHSYTSHAFLIYEAETKTVKIAAVITDNPL
ncbi:MAG: hypothetical protein GY862_14190 [Gammaproteobacteria bacterium]|nr:hypothetical protein [Gammaproteobacteria bacterium]